MRGVRVGLRGGWAGLVCGIALAACAPDAATPAPETRSTATDTAPSSDAPAATTGQLTQVGSFIGRVNLADGTLTFEPVLAAPGDDRVAQALTEIPAGTTLGGPNTVTLASTNLQNNCTVGGSFYSGSRCADVRITSQFTGTLRNVYFQIDTITPLSAAARNSDPAVLTLNNTLGLWGYGSIAAGATSIPRTWVFDTRSGTTSFSFRGRVFADPPCASNGALTNCGGAATCTDLSSDANNCGYCGVPCGASRACIAGVCTCPTGQTACSSGCINTNSDLNNCGGCGITCQGSAATCTNGVCGCRNGSFFCRSNTGIGGTCVADCSACPTGGNSCGSSCVSTCAACSGDTILCPGTGGAAGTCVDRCNGSRCRGTGTVCTVGGASSCVGSCPSCTAMGGTCG